MGKVTVGARVVRVQLDGEVYELPMEAWEKGRPGGSYGLTLSKNLDKIIGVKPPYPGTHIVKFKEFANRNNEIPEPKIIRGGPRKSKNGGSYIAKDRLAFTALLEVCDGSEYDGLCIADIHTYGFEPVPCWGCGTCRSACAQGALPLEPRAAAADVAGDW